jgi:hypothetical protein
MDEEQIIDDSLSVLAQIATAFRRQHIGALAHELSDQIRGPTMASIPPLILRSCKSGTSERQENLQTRPWKSCLAKGRRATLRLLYFDVLRILKDAKVGHLLLFARRCSSSVSGGSCFRSAGRSAPQFPPCPSRRALMVMHAPCTAWNRSAQVKVLMI